MTIVFEQQTRLVGRDAENGRFVTLAETDDRPGETVKETWRLYVTATGARKWISCASLPPPPAVSTQ